MSNSTVQSCNKGSEMQLYYNTGTEGTPVWVEHVGIVEDITINETDDLQEQNSRRSTRVVKEYNEGETELSITGTQTNDPEYEGWQFLNSARPGGTPKDCMILSGKIDELGAYGWRGSFWNSDRTTNGPAVGNMTNALNLQPSSPCSGDHVEVRVVKITGTVGSEVVTDHDATVWEAAA